MKARHYYLIVGTALTLMLSACGGSSSPAASNAGTGTGTGTTIPVTSTIDTFTQYVLNLFSTSADTAEPQAIDAAMVTAPEATEPVTIN
ncbi:hypothetical protein [Undibacterium umbellatum]|jgi:hypothetical protein|uniref:Lipoprotein n=1 Tax=Undibacterium umbellatum TaxID=2762300 RepID=A0ABR6ZF60_9BURK|nr:hypothetical protein [Undibacterium umbellatum]MBC3910284.1 hypothetical protein [Undibacterium umbellatum]